jgi:hypothetical protein
MGFGGRLVMTGWISSRGCATLFLASHVEWWCVMSSLCRRRCTLGRSVDGMSVQSVVTVAGMPPCRENMAGGVGLRVL